MIVEPKTRGFICTTAHPNGCAAAVKEQIAYVKSKGKIDGCKKALIIGASQGFGLSSRISAAFGCGADTLGLFFEKPPSGNKTASAGWYSTVAFEKEAKAAGLYAKSINGDAFSDAIRQKTIETIKKDLGKIDLFIYSLAAPRRTDPEGTTWTSTLKTCGAPLTAKTVNTQSGEVTMATVDSASDEEIRATVKVMGGEDWKLWVDALLAAEVFDEKAITVAYSYIGPEVTQAIYRNGTIGQAKAHLEKTARELDLLLQEKVGGRALVSVNKALVTQASSAIPIIPLYIGLLYKSMKAKGIHEGCVEQMQRLFAERLYTGGAIPVDAEGRIRIDDWEMRNDVQKEVAAAWEIVSTENLQQHSDTAGYSKDFLAIFGFGIDGVDYSADVEIDLTIEGLVE